MDDIIVIPIDFGTLIFGDVIYVGIKGQKNTVIVRLLVRISKTYSAALPRLYTHLGINNPQEWLDISNGGNVRICFDMYISESGSDVPTPKLYTQLTADRLAGALFPIWEELSKTIKSNARKRRKQKR